MRRAVDLPQPEGADQHEEFAALDLQVETIHGLHAAGVHFAYIFEVHGSH